MSKEVAYELWRWRIIGRLAADSPGLVWYQS